MIAAVIENCDHTSARWSLLGQEPDAQYRPTLITNCINAATCAGTANEQRVTIACATPNLLATSVTTANGTGTISAVDAVVVRAWAW